MALKNLQILVVDDDEGNRQLLETFLAEQGAQVTTCENGESAYNKMTNQVFSCIVSDVHMPIMDGIELLRKLRYILECDTPMILISGEAELSHHDMMLDNLTYKGAQGFLKKPFDLHILKNMILDNIHAS